MLFTVILILRINFSAWPAILYARRIVMCGLHADYTYVMGISFHGLFNNVRAHEFMLVRIIKSLTAAGRVDFSYESGLTENGKRPLAIHRSENGVHLFLRCFRAPLLQCTAIF